MAKLLTVLIPINYNYIFLVQLIRIDKLNKIINGDIKFGDANLIFFPTCCCYYILSVNNKNMIRVLNKKKVSVAYAYNIHILAICKCASTIWVRFLAISTHYRVFQKC